MWPVDRKQFIISFPYGALYSLPNWFKKGTTHKGIDLAPKNKLMRPDIYASVDGLVIHSGYQNEENKKEGFGLYVCILFIDKSSYKVELHYFAHLELSNVFKDQKVLKGDKIGVMGSSGFSTSTHLHYEVRRLGGRGIFSPINPKDYLT